VKECRNGSLDEKNVKMVTKKRRTSNSADSDSSCALHNESEAQTNTLQIEEMPLDEIRSVLILSMVFFAFRLDND